MRNCGSLFKRVGEELDTFWFVCYRIGRRPKAQQSTYGTTPVGQHTLSRAKCWLTAFLCTLRFQCFSHVHNIDLFIAVVWKIVSPPFSQNLLLSIQSSRSIKQTNTRRDSR